MASRFIKIVGKNKRDIELIANILSSKTFYPTKQSTPPLPDMYDENFDYRQFFIVYFGRKKDIHSIVYTREEYTASDFNTKVIPTADWVNKYNLTETPDIEEVTDADINIYDFRTTLYSFLSYDYQLYNNK